MASRVAIAPAYKSGISSGTLYKQPHPSIVEPKFRRAATDSSSRTSTPITPPSMETDILRALQLIQELSDQIAQNHKMASSLYAQTVVVKDQASVVTSGFSLRRFNVDISKETFESELERRNARLNIENQALLHENKQVDSLLKEYETTLETVMSKFRNHSYTGQRHEHTLTRHYEILIHTRETQAQSSDMSFNVQTVMSLHRIAFLLGCLLRCANGEEPEQQPYLEPEHFQPEQPYIDLTELEALVDKIGDDWWIQREMEIARLEKENEELRRMLKIDAQTMQESGVTLDVNRYDYGRTITRRPMQQQQQQQQPSSTPPNGDPKLPWVENDGQPQGPGPGGQRMTELQPGMRMGSQVRRSGIIGGGGQQRGLLVSGGMASTGGNGAGNNNNGRTFSLGIGPPPSTGGGGGQQAIWSNPPAVSPAPPLVVDRVVERPWLSGLDLSR